MQAWVWLLLSGALGFLLALPIVFLRSRQQAARWQGQEALIAQELNFQKQQLEQARAEHTSLLTQVARAQQSYQEQLQQAARVESALQHAEIQLAEKNTRIAWLEQQRDEQSQRLQHALTENSSLVSTQQVLTAQHEKQLSQLEQQKQLLTQEFQNIANKIFEEKGQQFSVTSQHSIEQLLKPFRDQMSEFRIRVDTIHKENNEANSSLRTQLIYLKELNQQMTADAQNLTRALKGDKKLAGNWGEVQLESSLQLAGLIAGDHYQREAVFDALDGSNKRPDFILKLPDGKHLILDSKVSLVDYDTALGAETDILQQQGLDAHVRAVRRHIDQLASRDYSNLIGIRSPNFVLLFMPIEPAYIEALKHAKDLFNYGFDRNVILVSHTTLMPILRTVANLWMIERGNLEAREISTKAGEIYNHLSLIAERLLKLGKTLGTANNHYNDTVRALAGNQGLYGKVERFKDLASNITRQLPNIEPSYQDVEYGKLEVILGVNPESEGELAPELER